MGGKENRGGERSRWRGGAASFYPVALSAIPSSQPLNHEVTRIDDVDKIGRFPLVNFVFLCVLLFFFFVNFFLCYCEVFAALL